MATTEAIDDLVRKMREERRALLELPPQLSEEEAEHRPLDKSGEDGWSVKEQLSHLAEMEVGYRAWVQRALAEENPDISEGTVRDPVAFPLEDAHDATIAEHLAELARQRERTMELIAGIAPQDYERPARSRAFGKLTVMQWLRSYYRHDRMHQAQISGRESEYTPNFLDGEPDQRRR